MGIHVQDLNTNMDKELFASYLGRFFQPFSKHIMKFNQFHLSLGLCKHVAIKCF